MHICEIKILIIVRWDRNFKVLVGFVSNESSGTRKSQTTSDIHSMLVNHLYAFFTFRKTGRVKLQGFTDLLAPIKTDSNHSWTLLCLCSSTVFSKPRTSNFEFFFIQKYTINEPEPKLVVQVRKLFKAEIFNTKGGENWPSSSSYFFFHLWMLFVLFGQVFFSTLSCSSSTWDLWELFVRTYKENFTCIH